MPCGDEGREPPNDERLQGGCNEILAEVGTTRAVNNARRIGVSRNARGRTRGQR